MSTLLQCYAVDPVFALSEPAFSSHSRIRKIGAFISGPQISFSCPLGEWVKTTLLGDLMDAACTAMDTRGKFVLAVMPDQLPALLGQLEALQDNESVMESDPEFIEEMTGTVREVLAQQKILWIGID